MHTTELEHIRSIKSFPSLLKYLRDELEWPIDSEEVEDITYEYDPEELGLDEKTAVKIKEIKQLRPLTTHQPWGIFFINFEPKRLPVVVLRRILRALVIKKRASAKQAHQKAWLLHDLMFISSYGEQEHRNITFAHFYEEKEYGDLPTLHVLGWDDEDTALHLEHAHNTLKEKLRWPEDITNIDAWRSSWAEAFTLRHREVITTSKELSIRLAELARAIRKRTNAILKVESERGPLRKLHAAFKESLIHDLSEDDFADMYAQTISYGLLTARVSRPGGLVADNIAEMVPVTNPFLKELLETFLHVGGRKSEMDFDELGINDVVDLLRRANMEAILRDFGNRNPNEDPVIHFYELFLKEYDAKKRMQRGVFFTPLPVVSYIVRSVHELLQTEFGLEDGLASTVTWGEMKSKLPLPPGEGRGEGFTFPAGVSPDDPFVLILDIASGTGTFMVMVIDVIYNTMMTKWEKHGHSEVERMRLWNDYVPEHLLPRLFGYELMMAPYAIAHMKIGLRLYETGYRFRSTERVHLYLTNTLEPPQDFSDRLAFDVPALAHEALAVNAVKRSKRFTVVIGNPPYAGISANMTDSAQSIVDAYKFVDGQALNERKLWLQDDYVKFIRKAQTIIDSTGVGVFGYITNHGYLDNPTFRGMRQSLIQTFTRLRVLDLHGNANKKERAPDGSDDQNVFDIRQGVGISLGSRGNTQSGVQRADLWGTRAAKYAWLAQHVVGDTAFAEVAPVSPYYMFLSQNVDSRAEYERGWPLPVAMPVNGVGMVTARDAMCIDFDADVLWDRLQRFKATPPETARKVFDLGPDAQSWKVKWAQDDLRQSGPSKRLLRPILYRPFDIRVTYYTGKSSGFICRPVYETMRHMLGGDNVAIITTRMTKDKWDVHVTRLVCGHKTCSAYDINSLFPLYAIEEEGLPLDGGRRRANYSSQFLGALATSLGLTTVPGGMAKGVSPESIFHYTYAVFHSPTYRDQYVEFLKIDFPRLPLTGSPELFHALALLGSELIALHLLESSKLDKPITEFIGGRSPQVEKVSWSKNTVWLDKAQTVGFNGVGEDVWNFHIGGYQVCEKWLKDRKGRTLTKDDIAHYQKIVVALSETIRLMAEIDQVIEKHGGWPGAFTTRNQETTEEVEQTMPEAGYDANRDPWDGSDSDEPEFEHEDGIEDDEEEIEDEAPQPRMHFSIDDFEYDEIICAIRQVFSANGEMDRDTAIRTVSHELGFQRTGDRIYEVINGAMIAAARRNIIITENGISSLFCRTIDEYPRDTLIEIIRSVIGRTWTDRNDAIRACARYLGFQRTGKNILAAFKSAINGGLRRGMLESESGNVRGI